MIVSEKCTLKQNVMDPESDYYKHLRVVDGEADGGYTFADSKQKYAFKSKSQIEFWKAYCTKVLLTSKNLGMFERVKDFPMLVLEFFMPSSDDSDTVIHRLVHTAQVSVRNSYSCTAYNTLCLVLKSGHKNGKFSLRLQFPFCHVDPLSYKAQWIPRITSGLKEVGFLDKMVERDVFDDLPMVGSNHEGLAPLKIDKIYQDVNPDMGIVKARELNVCFNLDAHPSFDGSGVKDQPDFDFCTYGPVYGSVSYFSMGDVVKKKEPVIEKKMVKDESRRSIAERMLGMIDLESRFDKEGYWLDVGSAISLEFGYKGLQLWIDLTKKSCKNKTTKPIFLGGKTPRLSSRSRQNTATTDRRIDELCNSAWPTIKSRNASVLTLAHYARIDSPIEYKAWHDKWVKAVMIDEMTDGTDFQIARAFHRMFWLEYMYVPSEKKNGKWYYFSEHRLFVDKEQLRVKLALMNSFKNEVLNVQSQLAAQAAAPNCPNVEQVNSIQKKLHAITLELERSGKVANVITAAKAIYSEWAPHNISDLFNSNKELTGMENGVIEAGSTHASFRAGKPEDYITYRTKVVFDDTFTEDHPDVQLLENWFSQLWPEPDLKSFMYKYFASHLRGGQRDKLFPVLTGKLGDNAKTTLIEFMETTFGEYIVKLSAAFLSEKEGNTGNASPHTYRVKNKRGVIFDEPDANRPFRTAVIKRWTGRDRQFMRGLFEDGEDVAINAKLTVVANEVPDFDVPDEPTKNRFLKIDMHTRYPKEGVPDTLEEQRRQRIYPRDENFSEKLPRLAPAFMWMLTRVYPSYISEKLVPPESVRLSTAQYWRDTDPYCQFQEERMATGEGSLSENELVNEYAVWYKSAFPGNKPPEKKKIKNAWDARLGKPIRGRYPGYIFKDPNAVITSQPAEEKLVMEAPEVDNVM